MTEQIYIDGTLMELDGNKVNVQLIYQSPILVDFQQIVSNRTTQVTLPPTNHNFAAIGYTSTQVDSNFAYQKHAVIYKRDGVQLLKGIATLLGVKKDGIVFCFTWGNVTALQALFDTNLRDLENTPYCGYPPVQQGDDAHRSGLNYGGDRYGVCCNAQDILTAIQNTCGVTGLMPLRYFAHVDTNYDMMFNLSLTTRNGDATTRHLQKFTGYSSNMIDYTTQFHAVMAWKLTDYHNYFDTDNGFLCVFDATSVHVIVNGNISGSINYSSGTPSLGTIGVLLIQSDTPDPRQSYDTIARLCELDYDEETYDDRIELTGAIDVDETYEVTKPYIGILIATVTGSSLSSSVSFPTFSLEFNEGTDEEVIFGTSLQAYPVFKNLPDMSCGQFIKNLLWMRGEFAYSKDGKEFQFISFNQIQENKANAVDWTKKLKGKPTEYTTTLENTAQKNYFRYAEADHYDNTQYEGMLQTEDETIQNEVEYCVSDFALAPSQSIPVWLSDGEGGYEFEGDNIPAIMMLSRVINNIVYQPGFFNNQRWDYILSQYYTQYARLIRKPVVLKANLVLTTYDLFTLDLTIPVYLQQTGHYYLIRKLSVKGSADCDVELIKI